MGGPAGADSARQHQGQHQGQQEMGPGQGRQGYTAVHADSDFGSASSLPSSASGALSVQGSRGQSLPQGLGCEGLRDKLTGAGSLAQQVPFRTVQTCMLLDACSCTSHGSAMSAQLCIPPCQTSLAWQGPPCTAHATAAGSMWQLALHLSAITVLHPFVSPVYVGSGSQHAPCLKHQTRPLR